jgi:peptidyl-prolyl cis-trans isomerase-like 3
MAVTLHTSLGDVKVELECALVPRNTENFLALCASGAYDGTLFHRSVPGFLVQGGDPTGTGKGGASVWGPPVRDEFSPELKHDRRGTVSMASSGPHSNGSQFFITYKRAPQLDGSSTLIGRVIHGFEVIDAMETVPVSGKRSRPVDDITLRSVTVHANPFADAART